MNIKPKSWLWSLTFPFAHNNYTTVGNTIYYPKGYFPNQTIIDHEAIHISQQREVGVVKFLFLYLFCLPFFYNPWRYKWEYEAFEKGSKLDKEEIDRILSSYLYGFLKNKR